MFQTAVEKLCWLCSLLSCCLCSGLLLQALSYVSWTGTFSWLRRALVSSIIFFIFIFLNFSIFFLLPISCLICLSGELKLCVWTGFLFPPLNVFNYIFWGGGRWSVVENFWTSNLYLLISISFCNWALKPCNTFSAWWRCKALSLTKITAWLTDGGWRSLVTLFRWCRWKLDRAWDFCFWQNLDLKSFVSVLQLTDEKVL